jgi:hypothetical protein
MANAIRFYREGNNEYYEVLIEKTDLGITGVLLDFIEESLRSGRIVHIKAERQAGPVIHKPIVSIVG